MAAAFVFIVVRTTIHVLIIHMQIDTNYTGDINLNGSTGKTLGKKIKITAFRRKIVSQRHSTEIKVLALLLGALSTDE